MQHPNTNDDRYDVILIGSGIGVLTSASILSQLYGERVLVLERHFKIGGFTHTFKRQGDFEWDVGLHYVGEMKKGKMPRMVFDYISGGKLKWQAMPDPYDVFVYPDLTFKAPVGGRRLKEHLIRQFPSEAKAIKAYFRDVLRTAKWVGRQLLAATLPAWLKPLSFVLRKGGTKVALQTTGEYLEKNFDDPKLKAVLVSQWGDYGLPPALSAFAIHSIVAAHYFGGGYYPVGSSRAIAESIIPIVEEKGGRLLVNHRVTEIIVEDNRAVGVRVEQKRGKDIFEKVFYANKIISGAGAAITYGELLPPNIDIPFRDELNNLGPAVGNVTLYLGLKESPKSIGLSGENYWIFNSYDHDAIYKSRNDLVHGKVAAAYVSFPSLKDPDAKKHTAEIIAFVDAEIFQKWAHQEWKKRDEEYANLKEDIAGKLIEFVELHITGFRQMVDFHELSTPLSTEFFTGHRLGNIYGLPATPKRFQLDWLGPKTPVKNLYITGADAGIHGIVGAMISAVFATGAAMGGALQVLKIFGEAKRLSAKRANLGD